MKTLLALLFLSLPAVAQMNLSKGTAAINIARGTAGTALVIGTGTGAAVLTGSGTKLQVNNVDVGSGSSTAGGTSGQLQYNATGTFGGVPYLSVTGSGTATRLTGTFGDITIEKTSPLLKVVSTNRNEHIQINGSSVEFENLTSGFSTGLAFDAPTGDSTITFPATGTGGSYVVTTGTPGELSVYGTGGSVTIRSVVAEGTAGYLQTIGSAGTQNIALVGHQNPGELSAWNMRVQGPGVDGTYAAYSGDGLTSLLLSHETLQVTTGTAFGGMTFGSTGIVTLGMSTAATTKVLGELSLGSTGYITGGTGATLGTITATSGSLVASGLTLASGTTTLVGAIVGGSASFVTATGGTFGTLRVNTANSLLTPPINITNTTNYLTVSGALFDINNTTASGQTRLYGTSAVVFRTASVDPILTLGSAGIVGAGSATSFNNSGFIVSGTGSAATGTIGVLRITGTVGTGTHSGGIILGIGTNGGLWARGSAGTLTPLATP